MSGIISWFASHLVVWSLLGFVVAGLVVFGAVPLPAGSVAAMLTVLDGRAEDRPRATGGSHPLAAGSADEGEPGVERLETVKRPRLIGGTLPLYGGAPVDGRQAPVSTADGFRPSAGPPRPVAPQYHDEVQRARRAFWNGDFEAAEAAYMDVIAAFPDDPEAFGELGNLYEAMGRPALARDALFAAGVRLKNRGAHGKLEKVIEILDEKGDERSQLLASPSAAAGR